LGSAKPRGHAVNMITLGSARAVQMTALEFGISLAFSKSHSPSLGEALQGSSAQRPSPSGTLEFRSVSRKIRVARQIFPGEAGPIERPQVLILSRRPPVDRPHGYALPCQLAVERQMGECMLERERDTLTDCNACCVTRK